MSAEAEAAPVAPRGTLEERIKRVLSQQATLATSSYGRVWIQALGARLGRSEQGCSIKYLH